VVQSFALGSLAHVVRVALEMFAALVVGADFGYLAAAGSIAWAALANMVGGLGLVTVLRLVQVGAEQSDVAGDVGHALEEPDSQPE
jgi:formate-nitrite transporter family protein